MNDVIHDLACESAERTLEGIEARARAGDANCTYFIGRTPDGLDRIHVTLCHAKCCLIYWDTNPQGTLRPCSREQALARIAANKETP